eukprot:Clim_evm104s153 gene=Clim_evmTU104s153
MPHVLSSLAGLESASDIPPLSSPDRRRRSVLCTIPTTENPVDIEATQQNLEHDVLLTRFQSLFGFDPRTILSPRMCIAGGSLVLSAVQSRGGYYDEAAIASKAAKSDIDIFLFAGGGEDVRDVVQRLADHFCITTSEMTVVQSPMAFNVIIPHGPLIQFITGIRESTQDVIDGFDFGGCAVGFDTVNGIVVSDRFTQALSTGLNVVNPEHCGFRTWSRVLKYMSRGFGVQTPASTFDQLLDVAARPKTPEAEKLGDTDSEESGEAEQEDDATSGGSVRLSTLIDDCRGVAPDQARAMLTENMAGWVTGDMLVAMDNLSKTMSVLQIPRVSGLPMGWYTDSKELPKSYGVTYDGPIVARGAAIGDTVSRCSDVWTDLLTGHGSRMATLAAQATTFLDEESYVNKENYRYVNEGAVSAVFQLLLGQYVKGEHCLSRLIDVGAIRADYFGIDPESQTAVIIELKYVPHRILRHADMPNSAITAPFLRSMSDDDLLNLRRLDKFCRPPTMREFAEYVHFNQTKRYERELMLSGLVPKNVTKCHSYSFVVVAGITVLVHSSVTV